MKKNYFKPEMNIARFSMKDVVTTTSGVTSTETVSVSSLDNDAVKYSVSYKAFNLTF